MIRVNAPDTGLKLGDNTPDRSIDCPSCNEPFEFNSNDLEWNDDDTFEFVDVDCECGKSFQICALSNGHEYEFFTV